MFVFDGFHFGFKFKHFLVSIGILERFMNEDTVSKRRKIWKGVCEDKSDFEVPEITY